MRKLLTACVLAAALSGTAGLAARADDVFRLTSSAVHEGATLPTAQVLDGFGCTGGNISPALAWSAPPAGTKSLAVTLYDPDAPTGSGWWHWVVFDLPPQTRQLAEGAGGKPDAMPKGAVQSRTDFGKPGYGGACPPKGDKPHHYIFTVWALDTPSLKLGPDASGAMVGYFLHAHALAHARLTARYGR